jgi:hypothetical protein
MKHLKRIDNYKLIKESVEPGFRATPIENNIIVSMFFANDRNYYNTQELWDQVIELANEEDCRLVNYIVTDSYCEFEFEPSLDTTSQDLLDDIRWSLTDAMKSFSSKFTSYDVHICGM